MLTIKTYTNNPLTMNKEVSQDLLEEIWKLPGKKKTPIKINPKSMNMGMLRPDKIQNAKAQGKRVHH